MSLFVFYCHDKPNTLEIRLALRPQHLARLQTLLDEGRLTLAGPMPFNPDDLSQGISGSLIVADFADLAQAKAWANEDPFLKNGVYDHIEVKPFIQALPSLLPK